MQTSATNIFIVENSSYRKIIGISGGFRENVSGSTECYHSSAILEIFNVLQELQLKNLTEYATSNVSFLWSERYKAHLKCTNKLYVSAVHNILRLSISGSPSTDPISSRKSMYFRRKLDNRELLLELLLKIKLSTIISSTNAALLAKIQQIHVFSIYF